MFFWLKYDSACLEEYSDETLQLFAIPFFKCMKGMLLKKGIANILHSEYSYTARLVQNVLEMKTITRRTCSSDLNTIEHVWGIFRWRIAPIGGSFFLMHDNFRSYTALLEENFLGIETISHNGEENMFSWLKYDRACQGHIRMTHCIVTNTVVDS